MYARTEVIYYVMNGFLSIWSYNILGTLCKSVLYVGL